MGPDGNTWVTDYANNAVGQISSDGGTVTEFAVPTAKAFGQNGFPTGSKFGITAGPDGALWFTEGCSGCATVVPAKIGRITTSGTITEFPLTLTTADPHGITAGPDGNLWFTYAFGVGKITTAGNATLFPISGVFGTLQAITAGPDGNLWATDHNDAIRRITTAGVATAFPILTSGSNPTAITPGPDGALWFTEAGNQSKFPPLIPGAIGRITTAGVVSEYPVSNTNAAPFDITAGIAGTLAFSENGNLNLTPTVPSGLGLVFVFGAATLTVNETGSGAGEVTSDPDGIDCGGGNSDCSSSLPKTGVVTLTATASSGSTFAGWSGGGCSGTSTCQVTLSAGTTVTATFTANQTSNMLSVALAGAGSGTVTSAPSGINCGATCSASFNTGTQVTLSAAAASGSTFAGWSGAGCSSTSTCQVILSADSTVTATFNKIAAPTNVLTVVPSGGGSGTVTSADGAINCGSTCSAAYAAGTPVTLTATAATGSTFAGWSGAGCSGITACSLTLNSDTTATASFVKNSMTSIALAAAVLPSSRSVQVGGTATAFATIIDAGPGDASTCTIAPATSIPATFVFQTTNPATNALSGTPNTPANIAQGQSQSFVIALTPTAGIAPTDVAFTFVCANANQVPTLKGINTLNLSASTTPVPDIVALAASGDPGIVDIPGATGTGVFAVATVNVGASGVITASANTGGATLPVALTICQTNPQTAVCLAAPAASVTTTINANATPTFGIFVAGSGAVPFSPGVNRVFVQFVDPGGVVRGSTSVAVRTQ